MMRSGNDYTVIGIPPFRVFCSLAATIFLLIITHSGVQICWNTQDCGILTSPINHYGYLFDLSRETNIPTWFSVVQIFLVAVVLAIAAITEYTRFEPSAAWWGLCAIFTYMSLDEATDMHGLWRTGMTDYVMPGTNSAHFAWIIPGIIIVLVIAIIYLRWILSLPSRTRMLFITAGVVFVSGGLVLEGVGAYIADESFMNTSYLIVATAEEALEMLGILIMLYAVLLHLEGQGVKLALFTQAGSSSSASGRFK